MIAIFSKQDEQDEALVNIEYFKARFHFFNMYFSHDTNCSI